MANTTINLNSNQTGFSYVLTSVTTGQQYAGYTTTAQGSVSVPVGQYNVSIIDTSSGNTIQTGYIDGSQTSDYFAQIVNQSDSSTVGLAKTPITGASLSTSVQIITPPESSEEFLAPDDNYGKYLTCEDARLYIGDVFIDENIYVQYTLQDNKIPIYGYRSRFYDAVAQGKSIVQGQLGINFVSEGYLWTVLKEYSKLAQAVSPNQDRLNNLVYTESQLLQRQKSNTVLNNYNPMGIANSNDQAQLNQIQIEKMKLVAQLGPSSLDLAQNYVKSFNTPSLTDTAIINYSNAVYPNVAFDLVLQFTGGQRTVTRRLEGCQLIANDQVIDLSGNTLSDGYSFIARRLR